MIRIVSVLFSCIILAACATQPVDRLKSVSYKRIGVLSAMGNTFHSGAVGVTVFGNEHRSEELDLGADDILTDKVKQALANKYEVVELTKYREAFLAQPKSWPGQQNLAGSNRPAAQEVVRNLMGSEQLDAYLIVTPGSFSVRGTNQGGGGIGIMKLQQLFGSPAYLLHTAYVITVIDGKDYSYAGDMRAIPTDETSSLSLSQTSRLSGPNWSVPPQLWEAPADNKAAIRNAISVLAGQSVPQTLRRAQMIE